VGKSGAKKSPQRRLLVDAPAQPLMLDLARTHSRAMEQWQEEKRGLKPAEQSDPPQAAYLQVSDFTIEALAEQLQRQEAKGLGLLINRDELSGLFGSLNAYKGGRGADEQHLLEAYDGGAFRSLRVASPGGGRFYDRCSLSIYGTIQPAVLEKLVASGDDSGLWARFMFVALPAKVVPLPEVETEIEQQEAAAAATALADACGMVYRMPRTSLALDPAARWLSPGTRPTVSTRPFALPSLPSRHCGASQPERCFASPASCTCCTWWFPMAQPGR
jgi:CRISPR-associated protein Cmr3